MPSPRTIVIFICGFGCAQFAWMTRELWNEHKRPDPTGVQIARKFEITPPENGRYDETELIVLQPLVDDKLTEVARASQKQLAKYHESWEKALMNSDTKVRTTSLAQADKLEVEVADLNDEFRNLALLAEWHGFRTTEDVGHYASYKEFCQHGGL